MKGQHKPYRRIVRKGSPLTRMSEDMGIANTPRAIERWRKSMERQQAKVAEKQARRNRERLAQATSIEDTGNRVRR